jgi:hypothetical protein
MNKIAFLLVLDVLIVIKRAEAWVYRPPQNPSAQDYFFLKLTPYFVVVCMILESYPSNFQSSRSRTPSLSAKMRINNLAFDVIFLVDSQHLYNFFRNLEVHQGGSVFNQVRFQGIRFHDTNTSAGLVEIWGARQINKLTRERSDLKWDLGHHRRDVIINWRWKEK